MSVQEIPFGGRVARLADEKTPLDRALVCTDAYVDTEAIVGRPGYRQAHASALGSGGDAPQFLGRFRPSATSARTPAVLGGKVYTLTDPSSETLSDGTAALAGSPFASTAKISGAQLGRYFYLGTDELNVAMRRLRPDYSLEALASIAQGVKPTSSLGSLSWTAFSGLTISVSNCVTQTNANTGMGAMPSTWRSWTLTNNGNDDPAYGAYVQFKLAADFDATGCDWLLIAVSPRDTNNANGALTIEVALDSAGSPSTYYAVGMTHDVPPVGGSPNCVYCDLRGVPAATRSAIRYIKITVTGNSGGKFAGYGYLFLPVRSPVNPQTYYVSFYNSTTLQESPLTEGLEVTVRDADVVIPTYPNCFLDNATVRSTGGNDDPFAATNRRIFNQEAAKAWPKKSEIGVLVTVAGLASAGWSGTLSARLWKDTSTGRRLVNTASVTAGAAYSIIDSGGQSTLANTLWKAGGAAPRCNALAAYVGRLAAGYENRLYISSYLPPGQTSDPYPQFPDAGVEDSDGWSLDIAPSNAEQIQSLHDGGDTLWIVTNLAVRNMNAVTPRSPVYFTFGRGGLGRKAALFVEERLFVAAYDGVYQFGAGPDVEMTREQKRLYRALSPDANVFLAYDYVERALFVVQGTTYLRYHFPSDSWTGPHTCADTFRAGVSWADADGTTETDFASDAFTDTTGTALLSHVGELGATWTVANGATGVGYITAAGRLRPNNSIGVGLFATASATPPSADYSVEAGFVVASAANEFGLLARMTDATALNFTSYYLSVTVSGGNIRVSLSKYVASVLTSLVGITVVSVATVGAFHTARLTLVGSTLTVYFDGALVATATDSAISTAGKAGLTIVDFAGATDNYGLQIDTWRAFSTATVTGRVPQLWFFDTDRFLQRIQSAATSDGMVNSTAGTAIANWAYSTGYLFLGSVAGLGMGYLDCTGAVTFSMYKDSGSALMTRSFTSGEKELGLGPKGRGLKVRFGLAGGNTTAVRRLAVEVRERDAKGA